jgi:transcriptional regulator with XRE-family HTH domain
MPKQAFKHDDGPGSAFLNAVGQRLAWAREVVGVTQQQVADMIVVDQSAYSKWENGSRLAAPGAMVRFCDLFGVSLDFIYRGKIGGLMRRDVELRLVAAHPELVPDLEAPARPAKVKARAVSKT